MATLISIAFVAFGLSFVGYGVSRLFNGDDAAPPVQTAPNKTGDMRVVKMSDGTYRIEYFMEHPGWRQWSIEYKTPDLAFSSIDDVRRGVTPRVVGEVFR